MTGSSISNKPWFVLFLGLLFSCSSDVKEAKEDGQVQSPGSAKKEINLINGRTFFKGKINASYEVYLVLDQDKEAISGKYFYTSQRKLLDISGVSKADSLLLKESYKSKITGNWEGRLVDDSFIGEWNNKSKKISFELEKLTDSLTFYSELNKSKKQIAQEKGFDNFLKMFPTQETPFRVDESVEEGKRSIDTATVQLYLEPDFEFLGGWGYNDFSPVFKYETAFGYVLGVHHFYTPGAFGIYNTYFKVYSFTKNGEAISNAEIGCFCYDSNMGANEFYDTELNCTFNQDTIRVNATHIHANLFEFLPEDSEYEEFGEPFHNEQKESYEVLINSDGTFVLPKD